MKLFLAGLLLAGLVGCGGGADTTKKPADKPKVEEKVKDAADKTKDAAKDAAGAVKDAAKDAAGAVKDAAKEEKK
jgi:hypothetical protein